MNFKEASTSNNCLNTRCNINKTLGNLNLNKFIFENITINGNEKILDIGCGMGNQTIEFAKVTNGMVTGIDLSEESLKHINAKNIIALKCDMDNFFTKEHDEIFDIISSTYSLYYSRNIIKLLNDIKASLSNNGRMVIVGPYGNNNSELFDIIGINNIDEYVLHTSSDFMRSVVLKYAVKNYRTIKTKVAKNEIRYTSIEQLMNYWKKTTFYNKALEKELEDKLKIVFEKNKEFILTKHIMLIEAGDKKCL